jgi:hypothetical protein
MTKMISKRKRTMMTMMISITKQAEDKNIVEVYYA